MNETLLTVKQFTQKHPAFSENAIRWLLFKSPEKPGLEKCFFRLERRVYIKEESFFQWLQETSDRVKAERGLTEWGATLTQSLRQSN